MTKGETDKEKQAKVLRQLRDGDQKILANPDYYIHNLIDISQLKGVIKDDKPFRPTKDPEPHITFKRPQIQEQDPSPEHTVLFRVVRKC